MLRPTCISTLLDGVLLRPVLCYRKSTVLQALPAHLISAIAMSASQSRLSELDRGLLLQHIFPKAGSLEHLASTCKRLCKLVSFRVAGGSHIKARLARRSLAEATAPATATTEQQASAAGLSLFQPCSLHNAATARLPTFQDSSVGAADADCFQPRHDQWKQLLRGAAVCVLCCVPPKQARLQVHSLRVDEQAGAVLEAVRRWPAEYTFAGEAQH